jgi:hypothetical protein
MRGIGGSSSAAEGEDEMQDGAGCDVVLACGFLIWPGRVEAVRCGAGVKEGDGAWYRG